MSKRLCSYPGCDRAHQAHGWCRMHYIRSRRGTPMDAPIGPRPAIERFEEKLNHADGGCIEWTGGTNGVGYGMFFKEWAGGANTRVLAHRWYFEYKRGPIPKGLHLDHLCRNPICVNPDHLEPVTQRENTLRGVGVAAVHAKKTHCVNGHELSGDNLMIRSNGRWRDCRACKREKDRRRYHQRKANAA